jgi:hypothetical protein
MRSLKKIFLKIFRQKTQKYDFFGPPCTSMLLTQEKSEMYIGVRNQIEVRKILKSLQYTIRHS